MHDFTPFYSPFGPALMLALLPLVVTLALWTLLLKGFALWHAARNKQVEWFIALLVINTIGILEIIYLIWFRKDAATHHSHASNDSHSSSHHPLAKG
jgi:Family of unknown function (DUF5652)